MVEGRPRVTFCRRWTRRPPARRRRQPARTPAGGRDPDPLRARRAEDLTRSSGCTNGGSPLARFGRLDASLQRRGSNAMPLPQVLAGPILRRVVGTEVAVWLALREPATVELVVWAGPQRSTGPGSVDSGTPPVARGTAPTKRFGAQLHVAVVVAEASAVIAPGAIHSYDVLVGGQGLRDLGLLRDEAALAGGDGRRPPVAPRARLRARPVAELRHPGADDRRPRARAGLVPADERRRSRRHGLPRRPHRRAPPGPDPAPATAVPHRRPDLRRRPVGVPAAADQRHRPGAARVHRDPPDRRPRRRRSRSRSSRCSAAARWSGRSVASPPTTACTTCSPTASCWRCTCWCGARRCGARWPPPTRCSCPSTKVEANHLSDWEAFYAPKPGDPDADGLAKWRRKDEPGFTEEVKRAEIFRAAVPRVARALANTATYMIFDDHEVTDDWYLSQSWRSRVLTAPFGRAIVRNGYAAYAVCQAWGNDPAAFTHTGQNPTPEERGAARHARRGRDRRRVRRDRRSRSWSSCSASPSR